MYSSIVNLIRYYKDAKEKEDELSAFMHQLSEAAIRIEIKIVMPGGQRDFVYAEHPDTIRDELKPLAEKRLEAARIKTRGYAEKVKLLKDVLDGINK